MASTSSGDPAPRDPLTTDPFWGPLRRRHPEVDVVLLPQSSHPAPGPRTATLPQARELEAVTRGTLEELLDVAALAPAAETHQWCSVGVGGAHRHVSRAVLLDVPDPAALVGLVEEHLAELGYAVRAGDPLEAHRAPVTVRVRAAAARRPTASGAVEIEVSSEPLPLDDAVRIALLTRTPARGVS